MKIIAHRGDTTTARENTLQAFQAAYDAGADGFEFDVRLSADAVPIVHHNMMLDWQGESVFVKDLTWEQLHSFDGYPISSLNEVLSQFAGQTFLELHLLSYHPRVVTAVYDVLKQYLQLGNNFEVTSYEAAIIQAIQAVDKTIACDLLFKAESWMSHEMAMRIITEKATLANARGVHLFSHEISAESVARFQQLGFTVHAGVVNDSSEFERIKALGIEQISTDNIHLYLDS